MHEQFLKVLVVQNFHGARKVVLNSRLKIISKLSKVTICNIYFKIFPGFAAHSFFYATEPFNQNINIILPVFIIINAPDYFFNWNCFRLQFIKVEVAYFFEIFYQGAIKAIKNSKLSL